MPAANGDLQVIQATPKENLVLAPDPRVEADQSFPPGIAGSFGVDLVDVVLDPAADGQPLMIALRGAPGPDARFNVALWKLMTPEEGGRPRRVPGPAAEPEVLVATNGDGHLSYTIPAIDLRAYNRLGLMIVRIDAQESSDPVGAYTIVLRADVGMGVVSAGREHHCRPPPRARLWWRPDVRIEGLWRQPLNPTYTFSIHKQTEPRIAGLRSTMKLRCYETTRLHLANDVAEDVSDGRTEQGQNHNNDNGDQNKNQRILDQALSLFTR